MKVKRFKDDVYDTVPEGSASSPTNVPLVKPNDPDDSSSDQKPNVDVVAPIDANTAAPQVATAPAPVAVPVNAAPPTPNIATPVAAAAAPQVAAAPVDDVYNTVQPAAASTPEKQPVAPVAPTAAPQATPNYTLENLASMTESPEQKASRVKKEKARAIVGGVGDALTVFSNIFAASKGAMGTGVKADLLNTQSAIMDKEGKERKANKSKLAAIKDRVALQENNRRIAARAAALDQHNKDRAFGNDTTKIKNKKTNDEAVNRLTADRNKNTKAYNDARIAASKEQAKNSAISTANKDRNDRVRNNINSKRVDMLGKYQDANTAINKTKAETQKMKVENDIINDGFKREAEKADKNGEILVSGTKGSFAMAKGEFEKIRYPLIDALSKDEVWMGETISILVEVQDPVYGMMTIKKDMTREQAIEQAIQHPDSKFQNLNTILGMGTYQSKKGREFMDTRNLNGDKVDDQSFMDGINSDDDGTVDGFKIKK